MHNCGNPGERSDRVDASVRLRITEIQFANNTYMYLKFSSNSLCTLLISTIGQLIYLHGLPGRLHFRGLPVDTTPSCYATY